MAMGIEELIEEIKALSPEEQQKLRETLAEPDQAEESLSKFSVEDALNRRLAEAGIITEFKRRARDREAFLKFAPVAIQGKPLSETIIEERR